MSSLRRKLAVLGISVLVIALLIGALELALRARGFRFSIPTLEALNERKLLEPTGVGLVRISPDLSDPEPFGYPLTVRQPQGSFPIAKDPRKLRIVLVADSTGHAFNWSQQAFVACLQERAGREIEFINLSFAGCGSDRTLPTTREALALRPDMMIVATGHSDFVSHCNPETYADFREHKGRAIAASLYQNLLSLQLLAKLSALATKRATTNEERKQLAARLQRSYSEEEKKEFYTVFRERLGAIAREAKVAGVPVIFTTMAYNYMIPPLWESGGKGPAAGMYDAPRMSLKELEKKAREPGVSLLYKYFLGRAYQENGQAEKAKQLIDEVFGKSERPFTATTETNRLIREAATAEGVRLVDIKKAVDEASLNQMANGKLMLDHCHLNLAGNQVMLSELCAAVVNENKSQK